MPLPQGIETLEDVDLWEKATGNAQLADQMREQIMKSSTIVREVPPLMEPPGPERLALENFLFENVESPEQVMEQRHEFERNQAREAAAAAPLTPPEDVLSVAGGGMPPSELPGDATLDRGGNFAVVMAPGGGVAQVPEGGIETFPAAEPEPLTEAPVPAAAQAPSPTAQVAGGRFAGPQAQIKEGGVARQQAGTQIAKLEQSGLLGQIDQAAEVDRKLDDVERLRIEKEALYQKAKKLGEKRHAAAIKTVDDHPDIADSRSLGQKFAGAIAMAMGAYASGMLGGPNAALQIVNDSIERDLDEQRDALGKKKENVTYAINDLDRMMVDHKVDLETGITMVKIAYLEKYKRGIESTAMLTKSEVVLERSKESGGLITQDQGKLQADLEAKSIHADLGFRRQRQLEKDGRERIALARQKVEAAKSGAVRQVPGWTGTATSDNSHKLATRIMNGSKSALNSLYEMLEMREQMGALEFLTPEVLSKMQSKYRVLRASVINKLKDKEGMGANFTLMEKELLEAGTPSSLKQWGFAAGRIRMQIEITERELVDYMEGFGFSPGAGSGINRLIEMEDAPVEEPTGSRPTGPMAGL